jgi:hypothetical protein
MVLLFLIASYPLFCVLVREVFRWRWVRSLHRMAREERKRRAELEASWAQAWSIVETMGEASQAAEAHDPHSVVCPHCGKGCVLAAR